MPIGEKPRLLLNRIILEDFLKENNFPSQLGRLVQRAIDKLDIDGYSEIKKYFEELKQLPLALLKIFQNSPYSLEKIYQIAELKNMYPTKTVAKMLNLAPDTVRKYARAMGIEIPYTGGPPIPEEKRRRIIPTFLQTKNATQTAKICGVSLSTVLRYLDRKKIPYRKRPYTPKEKIAKIVDLYEKLRNMKKVANRFNIARSTVSRFYKMACTK